MEINVKKGTKNIPYNSMIFCKSSFNAGRVLNFLDRRMFCVWLLGFNYFDKSTIFVVNISKAYTMKQFAVS